MKLGHASLSIIRDCLRNAHAAIRSNPVRAGLSIASVAIGVTLLVTSLGLVYAIRQGVAADLRRAGPLTFYVFREPPPNPQCSVDPSQCSVRRNPALTFRDAGALKAINIVRDIVLHVSWPDSIALVSGERGVATIDAYGPGWLDVSGNRITGGRDFSVVERRAALPRALVPSSLAVRLFGNAEPIGRIIRLRGVDARIIGVYAEPTSLARDSYGFGDEPHLVVPIEMARRRLGTDLSSLNFIVRPVDGTDQAAAVRLVSNRLRTIRRLNPAEGENFSIISQSQLLEVYNGVSIGFHIAIVVIGVSSLVVGGVGILTIMTITVAERTPEIGLRKALGATRSTILAQFLAEACMMSAAGTFVGIATSAVILAILAVQYGLTGAVSAPIMAGGAVFGTAVGGCFGFAPAARASSMSPLDALHHL
jgi:putative ABC transport system permease protein